MTYISVEELAKRDKRREKLIEDVRKHQRTDPEAYYSIALVLEMLESIGKEETD